MEKTVVHWNLVPVRTTSSCHVCSAHLTPVCENFPTQHQHMYEELRLIRPISVELLYTTNLVAHTALF